MESTTDADAFREIIRLLERKMGLIDDIQSSCCGVTFAQCHAIVEIGRASGISLNELADMLSLDKSTMSRTINNLVNNDMALREIDPIDRRYITIKLTEPGMKAYQEIEKGMGAYFTRIYQSIPEEKRAQVIESLQLLLQALADNECCKEAEQVIET